ncbi:MAG: DUF4830 domain-containing protein [Clostridia bacterium]|nr:DUF4830 domain-containing protein [Clostridia bacterium]
MYSYDPHSTLKKNLILTVFSLFLLTCIFSLMIGSTFHIPHPEETYLGIDSRAETSEQRIAFLRRLSYSPAPDTEELEQIVIPVEFGDVYTNYNELQKESGGDLSRYKGAQCIRCSYQDEETGNFLDLIIYENRIIGGDECTRELDGEMWPLRMPD